MKPYYHDEASGITIYCGDCREVLPTLGEKSVDCVVTSPPYNTLPLSPKASGMHAERKTGVNKWMTRAARGYSDNMPEEEYQEWLRGIVSQCLTASKGIVWVNHKVRYRDGVAVHPVRFLDFPIYSEVIWDRRGSMALNCKRFSPSHETLIGFGSPHFWNDDQNKLLSVWVIPFDNGKDDHPCAFPLVLAMRPIASSCPERGVVLDPFMGSGTTLVAAKHMGRKGVGVELEERYCEIAAKRLAQGTLFSPEPSPPADQPASLFTGEM